MGKPSKMTRITLPGFGEVMGAEEKCYVINVTPEKAADMIANFSNADNRKLRAREINKYKDDIASGRWEYRTNAITITDSGMILDGHHRLSAVARGNATVSMVVRIVDEDTKNLFDIGLRRTDYDITGLNHNLSGAVRIYWAYSRHEEIAFYYGHIKYSPATVMNAYVAHKDLFDTAYTMCNCGGHNARRSVIIAAVAVAIESGVSKSEIEHFCSVFNAEISTNEIEAIPLYARKMYDRLMVEIRSHGERQKETFALMQTAIYEFVIKKTRKQGYRMNDLKPVYTDILFGKTLA